MEFDKLFFDGIREKLNNNFPEAEICFRKALAIDDNNANVHFQLATVLFQQKREQEALFDAEAAVKLDPSNDWYNKFLVELYKNQKKFKEAAKICETFYKKSKDVNYLYELSGLEILQGNYSKALKALDLIEKQQGVQEDLSRQKEQIYLSLNKLGKAIKEIEKLSKAYPTEYSYQGMLADLYMANGKEKEALTIYFRILQADSSNGYAAFSLSDYYRIKNDTAKYFYYLQKGISSNVDSKIKFQVIAKLIPSNDFGPLQKHNCHLLVDLFMLSNPDDPAPFLFKGDLFLQDRNLEDARKYYVLAIGRNGNSLVAWEQILFCDQQLQRYDYMQLDCEKLIELFPTYANAYLFHSIASRFLKQYDKALKSAREGLMVADDKEVTLQLLNNLGDVAHYAKQYSLSDSAYEAALLMEPNNSNALNNYAYFLSLRNEKLNKADSMSLRSIELDPDNASNLDTYGWILFQKKDYENARIYVEKSLKINPESAEVLEHLGDILFKLKEPDKALEYWQRAKEHGADSEALLKKLRIKKLDD